MTSTSYNQAEGLANESYNSVWCVCLRRLTFLDLNVMRQDSGWTSALGYRCVEGEGREVQGKETEEEEEEE